MYMVTAVAMPSANCCKRLVRMLKGNEGAISSRKVLPSLFTRISDATLRKHPESC